MKNSLDTLDKIEKYLEILVLKDICSNDLEFFKSICLKTEELDIFADRFLRWACFWDIIVEYQDLTDAFIDKHLDKIMPEFLLKHQHLSEETIYKVLQKNNYINLWPNILESQNLSEKFLIKHIDKVNKYIFNFRDNIDIDKEVKKKILNLIKVQKSGD